MISTQILSPEVLREEQFRAMDLALADYKKKCREIGAEAENKMKDVQESAEQLQAIYAWEKKVLDEAYDILQQKLDECVRKYFQGLEKLSQQDEQIELEQMEEELAQET